MKKYFNILVLIFGLIILTGCEKIVTETKLGTARIANGTRSFVVATIVMRDNIIDKAIIDEYQYLNGEGIKCVPNGDSTFKSNTGCLASKRENNDVYSKNMKAQGGATKELIESYNAIEKYVEGKTENDLVALISGKTEEDMVDTISGCTLDSTKVYIESIIEAIKNAQ